MTTPWTAGGVTKDRYVIGEGESEGIFSLGDVNIFPSEGPGPVAIAAGAEMAALIVKAVNSHDALVTALEALLNDHDRMYIDRVVQARAALASVKESA